MIEAQRLAISMRFASRMKRLGSSDAENFYCIPRPRDEYRLFIAITFLSDITFVIGH
jgi:hypothetical protein